MAVNRELSNYGNPVSWPLMRVVDIQNGGSVVVNIRGWRIIERGGDWGAIELRNFRWLGVADIRSSRIPDDGG